MSSKGFTTGLIAGAVLGAAVGMIADPIKDKQQKKMVREKDNMFKMIGGVIDSFLHM